MSKKIMLAGEPMGLFIANEEGALENVTSFSIAVAGAELNVAIGLSRLEHSVGYLTKLGNDPFGKRILNTMSKNGISKSLVAYSNYALTGSMMKSKVTSGDPEIFYFRKNSAASTLSISDIESIDFSDYGILHMTGIFPALSQSTFEASKRLMEKAKEHGLTIFFDPNLRPQLWENKEKMIETINLFAYQADYFLPGVKESETLMGSKEPEKIAEHYFAKGVKNIIIKTGKYGAYGANSEGSFVCPTYQEDKIVDTVGAGDGFAAGVLSAINEGLSLKEAVNRANAIGTIQIQSVGDNDGLPTRQQLEEFMKTHKLKEIE